MSEVIVTLILIGFVVGGGLFIFWPDLASIITKPRRNKAKKAKKQSAAEIYEKHYSKEDELIEASQYIGGTSPVKNFTDIHASRRALQERGTRIKAILANPASKEGEHNCPVCGQRNHFRYGQVSIECICDRRGFRAKVHDMLREAGIEVW